MSLYNAAIVDAASSEILQTQMNLAILVLLFYEYLILLSDEVRLMWGANFRISTFLYYSVRYPLVLGRLLLLLSERSSSSPQERLCASNGCSSCIMLLRFSDAFHALDRVAITGVLVARTYAICDQNCCVLICLGLLGLTIAVVDYYEIVIDSCEVVALSRAIFMSVFAIAFSFAVLLTTPQKSFIHRVAHLFNSVSRLIFDTAVLILTLYKTTSIAKLHRRIPMHGGSGITSIIMKNSSFYFGALFTVEILNTLAFFVNGLYLSNVEEF
ncbi:hypothetical protein K439DRAFT_1624869 [Ramaria rubella]|nr:hypothetical protein K439DRAFT_1624869 [Ramaria rubella]